ncbi:MAG: sigma-70 family RNA polymerase sigma factor [Kofleriaceae bacterium]
MAAGAGYPAQMVADSDDRLTSLYRTYGPVIYARCVRLLGDRASAEDATQETFVRVHRHVAKAPDAREALMWIYRIATNYCLNELRDRKLRPSGDSDGFDVAYDLGEMLANRDLVERIVRRSPEQVRAAAWLHHVDGMDQGEVARVLGVSRRTVVNKLSEFAANATKFIQRSA